MNRQLIYLGLTASVSLLSACGGSDNGTTGKLTLNVTDAPVDKAQAVVVSFSSVTLKGKGELEDVVFNFDEPRSIDLLTLQGKLSQPLLENVSIPAGEYTSISLGVNAEFDTVLDSYITTEQGNQYELQVNSGDRHGLKLNGAITVVASQGSVAAGEDSVYTIDFNLRKSVINPPGQLNPQGQPGYFLKPVLRLVQNIEAASVSGQIDSNLLTGSHCSDNDPQTYNAVYAYEGLNVSVDDMGGDESEPFISALVKSETNYQYSLAYLKAGDYTLAFTCATDQDEDGIDDAIQFVAVTSLSLQQGEDRTQNLSN